MFLGVVAVWEGYVWYPLIGIGFFFFFKHKGGRSSEIRVRARKVAFHRPRGTRVSSASRFSNISVINAALGGQLLHQASSMFYWGKRRTTREYLESPSSDFYRSMDDRAWGFTSGKPSSSSTCPLCMLTNVDFIRLGLAVSLVRNSNTLYSLQIACSSRCPPWKTMVAVA